MSNQRKNPFVGPRSFKQDEREFFFGREREARDLLSLVVSERLVLFYAQSGAGKSSLINTCLKPDLKSKGFEVLPVGRVKGDDLPPGTGVDNIFVYNLVLHLTSSGKQDFKRFAVMPLPEFLAGLVVIDDDTCHFDDSLQEEDNGGYGDEDDNGDIVPRVLIIDQFEEIFTTNPAFWHQREAFFKQLHQAMQADPYLWIILVMREDYIASLDPYAHLLPGKLRARFPMQRMERDAALKAVKKPVENIRPFAEGVAEKLVENLCQIQVKQTDGTESMGMGQYVEPVQLQVACYQLWESLSASTQTEAETSAKLEITEADLTQLAGSNNLAQFVDKALAQFYEQAVKEIAQKNEDITEFSLRDWFENKLITQAGTRALVRQEENQTGGLDNRIVEQLRNRFLLNAETRADSRWYELVHDRFVEPILQANAEWRIDHPLLQAAKEWQDAGKDPGKLYEGQQLADALRKPEARILQVQEFLTACVEAEEQRKLTAQAEEDRRRADEQIRWNKWLKRAVMGATILVLIAAIATFIAIKQKIEADRNAEVAATKQAEADRNAEVAATRQTEAEAAKKEAEIANTINQALSLANASKNASDPELKVLLAIPAIDKILEAESNFAVEMTSEQTLTQTLGQTRIVAEDALNQAIYGSRVRFTLSGHSEPVRNIIFSPKGTHLATASEDNTAKIWNASTGENLLTLKGHRGDITSIAFSPDGTRLATGSLDDTAKVWDTTTGEALLTFESHTEGITSIAFSPDGTRLATASEDNTAKIWDASTGEKLLTLKGHKREITSIAFSPDGIRLVTGSLDDTAKVWDVTTGEERFTFNHDEDITSMAFSHNGARLATAGDNVVKIWDTGTDKGEALFTFNHNGNITSMAFSRDGTHLVTAGANTAKIWNANADEDEALFTFNHGGNITAIAFSPDNNYLATAGANTAKIWDADADKVEALFTFNHGGNITAIAFNPDNNYLTIASDDSIARVWNTSFANEYKQLWTDKGKEEIVGLAFSPNSTYLAIVYEDGETKILETETNRQINSPIQEASTVAFRTEEELLTANTDTNQVNIWNIALEQNLVPPPQYNSQALPEWVMLNPDGTRLAAATEETISVWNIATGHQVSILGEEQATGANISTSDTKNELSASAGEGSEQGSIAQPQKQKNPEISEDFARAGGTYDPDEEIQEDQQATGLFADLNGLLTFDPGGKRLATGNNAEKQVTIWDVSGKTDKELFTLDIQEKITGLAFNHDGTRLATAEGKEIHIWDLQSRGQEFLTFSGQSAFTSIIFSPDGKFLAAATDKGMIRLYLLDIPLLDIQTIKEIACRHTSRNLKQNEWAANKTQIPSSVICPQLPIHPSVIVEYLDNDKTGPDAGQIEEDLVQQQKSLGIAPERAIAKAYIQLGRDAISKNRYDDAWASLNQADRSQLEPQEQIELAYAYHEICRDSAPDNVAKDACQQAIAVAQTTNNLDLNQAICRNASAKQLAEVVKPACVETVALATNTNLASLNFDVCRNDELIEFKGHSPFDAACRRAVDLTKNTDEASVSFRICQSGLDAGRAELVAPACQQAVNSAEKQKDIAFLFRICQTPAPGENIREIFLSACDNVINLADNITGKVSVSSEESQTADSNIWTFNVDKEEEQVISIKGLFGDEAGEHWLILRGPDGEPIYESSLPIKHYRLPVTGTYFVNVQSSTPYTLSLVKHSPHKIIPEQLVEDTSKGNSLFTFTGQTGQVVRIQMSGEDRGSDTSLTMKDPDWSTLDIINDDTGQNILLQGIVLPKDGVYTIIPNVSEEMNTGAYTYTLRLSMATPLQLNFGDSKLGDLDNYTQWVFAGRRGDVVSIDLEAEEAWLDTSVALYDPDQRLVVPEESNDSYVLQRDGLYTIVPEGSRDTGTYTLSLVKASTRELVFNTPEPVAGELEKDEVWVFAGRRGDVVRIDMEPTDKGLDPSLALYDPDQRLVVQTDEGDDSLITNLVLQRDGRYIIIPGGNEDAGAYTLSLAKASIRELVFNTPEPVAGELEKDEVWVFAGRRGDVVSIDLEAEEAWLDTSVALYDPDQRLVVQTDEGDDSSITNYVLQRDGRYTIIPRGNRHTGAYKLSLGVITRPIRYGQELKGDTKDNTVWIFAGKTGEIVDIALDEDRSHIDPYLTLVNPDGTTVTDDDSGPGYNSLIDAFILSEDGSYRIIPTSLDSNGKYRLSLKRIEPVYIQPQKPVLGNTKDDTPWVYHGKSGQIVTIAVDGEGWFDPVLTLLGPDGATVASGHIDDDGKTAMIQGVIVPQDGDYFLDIGPSGLYSYTLSLKQETPKQITFGEYEVDDITQVTAWTFTGEMGQTVAVAMDEADSDVEVGLTLVGPSGQILADQSDSLMFTISEIGPYTIVGRGYPEDGGQYTLILNQIPPPTSLRYGDTVNGEIMEASTAYWTFEGNPGEIAKVTIESSAFNPNLRLYNPTGELIGKYDDTDPTREDLSSWISITGTHVIAVSGADDSQSGPYTLSLAQEDNIIFDGSVLAWTKYTDMDEEYAHILDAIERLAPSGYEITETDATDENDLEKALAGYSVFLIPEQEEAGSETLAEIGSRFGPILEEFISQGGRIIALSDYNSFLKAMGLLDATHTGTVNPGELEIVNFDVPVTQGLSTPIDAENATDSYHITNEDINVLVEAQNGNAVVATRAIGLGQVVLIGYDYFESNNHADQLLVNAVFWPQ